MIYLVVQGPKTQWTEGFIRRFLQKENVWVIFSSWRGSELSFEHDRLQAIYSEPLANNGPTNINAQISSSATGLSFCPTNEVCIKIRSDMYIDVDEVVDFFKHINDGKHLRFADYSGPLGKICVLGMYHSLFAHCRDHLFVGYTQDLQKLFDIPHTKDTRPYNEWEQIRAETYIGSFYYALFDNKVYEFIANPELYLTDKSPKRQETLIIHNQLKDAVFQTMPRLKIEWPKHYPNGYPYEGTAKLYGEYWYDDYIAPR